MPGRRSNFGGGRTGTRSFRTREPVRVVGELEDRVGHTAEQQEAVRAGLADLERRGLAVVDD